MAKHFDRLTFFLLNKRIALSYNATNNDIIKGNKQTVWKIRQMLIRTKSGLCLDTTQKILLMRFDVCYTELNPMWNCEMFRFFFSKANKYRLLCGVALLYVLVRKRECIAISAWFVLNYYYSSVETSVFLFYCFVIVARSRVYVWIESAKFFLRFIRVQMTCIGGVLWRHR